jgi:hypothetical protein
MNNKQEKSWDYLNVLTKQEIIDFLKKEYWYESPDKYNVNYFKWSSTNEN